MRFLAYSSHHKYLMFCLYLQWLGMMLQVQQTAVYGFFARHLYKFRGRPGFNAEYRHKPLQSLVQIMGGKVASRIHLKYC